MADVKISALPAATTPLAGTEVLPIVQGGTTDQVTVANLTAGRTVAAATLNVDANSATAAVRITQTGAGNAILVEDSANPDATPFVVDTLGRVLIGNTVATGSFAFGDNGNLQMMNAYPVFSQYSASAASNAIDFVKSRSATIGTQTVVQSGDNLGVMYFSGSDGTNFIRGAQILAVVDGTPGTNDMPGRLVFSTTADGASTPTERMRISSDGNVGIGAAAGAQYALRAAKNITGGTFAGAFACDAIVQADVTARADYYLSSVACAAGTYGLINGFQAQQGTFTGTVTAQNGYRAAANLIGATTNIAFKAEDTAGVTAGKTAYGFFSAVNTATGGGTTYAFYAGGTAPNFFAGDMQFDKTVTAAGTTGAQTINKNAGTVNFAAAATSLVVTNSRVTANSIVIATVATNDTTMKSVIAVAGAGSFTLTANAAATAETRVNWLVIN
jgi:hypothetical protein